MAEFNPDLEPAMTPEERARLAAAMRRPPVPPEQSLDPAAAAANRPFVGPPAPTSDTQRPAPEPTSPSQWEALRRAAGVGEPMQTPATVNGVPTAQIQQQAMGTRNRGPVTENELPFGVPVQPWGAQGPTITAGPDSDPNTRFRQDSRLPQGISNTPFGLVRRDPRDDINDIGASVDRQNPIIMALGGPVFGQPGAIPGRPQSMSPHDYATLLQAGGQQLLGQGELGLKGMSLLGAKGLPGQLDVNASNIAGNSAARQREGQLAQMFTLFAQNRPNNSMTDIAREWRQSGMQLPAFLTNQQPASGQQPSGGPGGNVPPVGPAPGGPPPIGSPGAQEPIESRLNALHSGAVRLFGTPGAPGQRGTIPAAAASRAISHIVSGLGADASLPEVQKFLHDNFGPQAVNEFLAETVGRNLPGGNTSAIGRMLGF